MSSANTLKFEQDSRSLTAKQVEEARCDMAAMFRIAAREDLHEGIDNHFSYALEDGTFLVNRWGVHWSRMRASDVLRIDHDGKVLEGEGNVETTAFYIHEAVHRLCPHAKVILHTHMPYTTALSCVEGGLNETLSQGSLFFYQDVVYETYGGLANDREEGERLGRNIGDKRFVILENHGPMVLGPTPGIAIHDLYFLERAARVQVLAQSLNRPLRQIPDDVARLTARQIAELDEDKETYFTVMKGILDETEPGYRS
jgi:ribulose-5-phosphate 4-epimerase/fuculose-1-phosphate aldolase